MLEVLLLYLIIPGRINFLQLGRYGRFGEQRYREPVGRKFDWLSFNANLVKSELGNRVAIAFDPSYISKSGKCTPYLGRFWSGCAKKAKRGLEISGIEVIDIFSTDTKMKVMDIQEPDLLRSYDRYPGDSTETYIIRRSPGVEVLQDVRINCGSLDGCRQISRLSLGDRWNCHEIP